MHRDTVTFILNQYTWAANVVAHVLCLLLVWWPRQQRDARTSNQKSPQAILLILLIISLSLIPLTLMQTYTAVFGQLPLGEAKLRWWLRHVLPIIERLPFILIVAVGLQFVMKRYGTPLLSNWRRAHRAQTATDRLSDIREEKERYTGIHYDPTQYYQDDQLFIGINENKKPLYIDKDVWRETNMQIVGPTRTGKGVLIGNLINQSVRFNHTVFYIDPKGDAFIPHIMNDAAQALNRTFIYLDLTDNGPGSWHPFVGGDKRARRARLLSAFGLEDTGEESDFFKGRERQILDTKLLPKSRKLNGLMNCFQQDATGELKENAARLYGNLQEWCEVKSLSPKRDGVSIEKALINNSIVYVKGSLDDRVVRTATRLFIMEIMQEVRRLHLERTNHCSVYIDELRFLVSNTLVDALATVAGVNTNIIVAYQSIHDLKNTSDKSIDPSSIETGVNTNCQLKFVYGCLDPNTAEWASRMSGERYKLITKSETTNVGVFGEESWESERTLTQKDEALITMNTMFSLKPRVGVLFQPRELSEIIFTAHVATTQENDFSVKKTESKTADETEEKDSNIESNHNQINHEPPTVGVSIDELF